MCFGTIWTPKKIPSTGLFIILIFLLLAWWSITTRLICLLFNATSAWEHFAAAAFLCVRARIKLKISIIFKHSLINIQSLSVNHTRYRFFCIIVLPAIPANPKLIVICIRYIRCTTAIMHRLTTTKGLDQSVYCSWGYYNYVKVLLQVLQYMKNNVAKMLMKHSVLLKAVLKWFMELCSGACSHAPGLKVNALLIISSLYAQFMWKILDTTRNWLTHHEYVNQCNSNVTFSRPSLKHLSVAAA